jgi:hypothetical protein
MSHAIACRSPLQIAEDNLLMMMYQHFNESRAYCERFRVQLRVLNPKSSAKARELFERWEGSDADIRECDALMRLRWAEMIRA